MKPRGRIATLLVAGAALAASAACAGDSGGSGGSDKNGHGGTPHTPSTTSAGLRWSPPRQGPRQPTAGTAEVSRERHGQDLNGDG
ncbi:hypothetical protein [Streptomyces violaceusniger]|uniref:Lipoprotein n=1 Tax=Streptomyces violaceusniger TaxID=68280 RepID=A0A4D4L6W3_STRVO|nr:hypothetical protein SVIO_067870 [Streptomyces violaceusniger]